MGPLLYLIYVNDISNLCQGNILLFADDTTVYLSSADLDELYQRANIQINDLFEWFCSNRLSLNAGKTKYIVIRQKHLRDDLTRRNLMIKYTLLTRIGNDCDEKSTKFLGILFDENLTWRDHVSHVNKKISRALFSIKQVRNTLPVECLRTLYYSLVHSHLTYGLIAWGNATQSVLHQTQMLQKRAIRVANNAKYNSHTDPLFRASAVMKLHDILEYQEALFVFDFMRNQLPMSFSETFTFNKNVPNARLTRQSDLLHIPRCRSHFADKLPLFAVANNWNKWVQKVALNTPRSHFKRQLKMKIFDNYPKQIKCNNNHCSD